MSIDTISETELASLLKTDPNAGFAVLYSGYSGQIRSYIKRITFGLLQHDDLLDVFQDTMVAIFSKIKQPDYDAEKPLLALIRAIARNKGVDELRRRGHQVNLVPVEIADLVDGKATLAKFIEEWKQLSELRETLVDIILKLADRERLVARVFVDHFEEFGGKNIYERLTVEVNRILSKQGSEDAMNPEGVKSAWQRARKKIKEALKDKGYPFI